MTANTPRDADKYDTVRSGKADLQQQRAWQEGTLYGALPDWYNTLDEDLRARVAPHLWMGELRTGKLKLREQDVYEALRDFAVTIQAQRAEVARLRGLLDELTEHYQWSDDFGSECIHCGGKFTKHGVRHLDDCPHVKARAILDGDA